MSDTVEDTMRTGILGSQVARRGPLPFPEPVLALYGLGFVLVLGWYFVFGPTVWMLLFAVAVFGVPFLSTVQINGHRSYAAEKVHQLRTRMRRKAGEHIYRNVADPFYDVPGADPGWEFPVPLGWIAPLDLSGTGLDDFFVLEHRTAGDNDFFTVRLAVSGMADGLRGDEDWAVTMSSFGRAQAALSKRSSLVRGIEMLHRSVPSDLEPHLSWMEDTVRANPYAHEVMPAIESYGQLIESMAPVSEDHSTYITLILPKSTALKQAAGAMAIRKGVSYEAGMGQVILDETNRACETFRHAHLGMVQVLGEQRSCAVIRAMLDPSFPLNAHRGARFSTCWPSYVGDHLSVRVADRWNTRVGIIREVEPIAHHAQWLNPLLTSVEPDAGDPGAGIAAKPTIRTVKVRVDFVDAVAAREIARRDSTDDAAKRIKEQNRGQVTDGTSEVMQSESSRRRADLMPGGGHHGTVWMMAVSVTAEDEDAALRASSRVEVAAENCGINRIEWRDDDHDVAQFFTVPVGQGLAATRQTRVK